MRSASGALALGWLLLASPAAAEFSASDRGTTAAGFLKVGAGARAVALGEAYSAVADDATALYWNPAAMTRVGKCSASFMHAEHLDSSSLDYAAFAHRTEGLGAWGVGAQFFSAGRIKETDVTGTEVGTFSPNDLALSIGYAWEVGSRGKTLLPGLEGNSVGVAFKYVRSTILSTDDTLTTDVGYLSPPFLGERVRVALSASNLGGELKYEREEEALPLTVRLGTSLRLAEGWTVSADALAPRDNRPVVAAGTEVRLFPPESRYDLAGRLGFNSRTLGDIDGFTGVSTGLGFRLGGMSLDYAFLPFGGLGLTHRVSLTFAFGTDRREKPAPLRPRKRSREPEGRPGRRRYTPPPREEGPSINVY